MKTFGFLALIFFAMLAGCESSNGPSTDNSQTSASAEDNGVLFTLTIPKTIFELDDTLTGVFKVINESDSEKVFLFPNLQQNGFQLIDINGRISIDFPLGFLPAESTLRLEPGERKEYSIISPFRNFDGEIIERGKYKMSAFLLEDYSPKVIINIEVR
ncbi:MAG: hypothetical protein IPL67_13995 [Ignavibacteria bacterium]|nr:hypothetical protein [Ignavibacteria bacterium]